MYLLHTGVFTGLNSILHLGLLKNCLNGNFLIMSVKLLKHHSNVISIVIQ